MPACRVPTKEYHITATTCLGQAKILPEKVTVPEYLLVLRPSLSLESLRLYGH